jgi:hypothetical protein
MRPNLRCIAFIAAALLAACAGAPPPPDWQMNAKGSIERAIDAYLAGNARVEALEFGRARAEVARTGRPDLLARLELMRCAARVASLVFDDCPGFTALAGDAAAPERAYADYLAGRLTPAQAAQLPAAHRDLVAGGAGADALARIAEPWSRLVGAGVLLRRGQAGPEVIALAVDAASAQGWRRPLLAWLGVQAQGAERAGRVEDAARVRRRIALVQGTVNPP